jgi:hypothetical protein
MIPVGLYEHGEKARELLKTCVGDFNPISESTFSEKPKNLSSNETKRESSNETNKTNDSRQFASFDDNTNSCHSMTDDEAFCLDGRAWLPREEDFDEKGEFDRRFTDAWGVGWRYRIFGVQGHPYHHPVTDWSDAVANLVFPQLTEQQFEVERKNVEAKHAQGFYAKVGWVNYFERSYSLRSFEDVLADIAMMDSDFLRFTERMHEYNIRLVERWLATGADAIQFADDFGMQSSLLISRNAFRAIYLPLYKELVDMVHRAGRHAFFHCCGHIEPLLEDFKEIGFDTLWPQFSAHDLPRFAEKCRDLRLAVCIHPDRGGLMTSAPPEQVKQEIARYVDLFRPHEGGAWLYFEFDNGFPYANVVAAIEAYRALRGDH